MVSAIPAESGLVQPLCGFPGLVSGFSQTHVVCLAFRSVVDALQHTTEHSKLQLVAAQTSDRIGIENDSGTTCMNAPAA
jgi:hypothetical protein